jgi:ribosomal protein S18 acetylase RimI-like enzyme
VAVDERGVVGTVTFVEPTSALREIARDGEAEIRSLAVAPAATGEGIGESLTRHTIARARQQGFESMVLSSSTTMHAAHRLYERLGFTRLPERDWSPVPGVQLVAYVLPL